MADVWDMWVRRFITYWDRRAYMLTHKNDVWVWCG